MHVVFFLLQIHHARVRQHVQLLHCSIHTWAREKPTNQLHCRGDSGLVRSGKIHPNDTEMFKNIDFKIYKKIVKV